MKKFIEMHKDNIHGVLSCVDRIIFKGYSPLSWSKSMEDHMTYNGLLLKDFKSYAQKLSQQLCDYGLETAQKYGRPYFRPEGKYNKEERARETVEKYGISDGLVCVISALENSPTFKMIPGDGRPKLINASVPCLCLYYYIMDRTFGMMHIRIQTWLPFTVQVYINGHEWLARKMTRHGVEYEQADNCFTWISDVERAQKFSDEFQRIKWERVLPAFARRVNPLPEELFPQGYYWVVDQAEYATDVMFKNSALLEALYGKLLERSILRFGPKDVLTFLGKKFDGRFNGEQINSMKKRHAGARVKHWIKHNWMKMYNKFGSVLRVETVINDPYSFKILRNGKRNGDLIYGWFPMGKGVANLYRYAEICLAANGNYLDALSIEPDPRPARESLRMLSSPVVSKGHRYSSFNPVSDEDIRIFKTVMNGDYVAFGFQNRDIRKTLLGDAKSPKTAARLSARTGRLLKKLQAHGLIAKIQRSRRWRVTEKGWTTMSSAVEIYEKGWAQVLDKKAA